jgi:hypothetical protein
MRVATLCLMLAVSCRERITVGDLRLVEAVGVETLQLDDEALQQRVTASLERDGFLLRPEDARQPGTWRVRASVFGKAPDFPNQPLAAVHVSLQFQQRTEVEPVAFGAEGVGTQKVQSSSVEDLQRAHRVALDLALRESTRTAKNIIAFQKRSAAALAKLMTSSDAAESQAAVVILVARKDSSVLPILKRRLETDDAMHLRRTVGLMVELGDVGAVNALIDASRRKDAVLQRELLFAIAALGGEDAQAYLFLVSSGHDDPLIRASAERALEELKMKQQH